MLPRQAPRTGERAVSIRSLVAGFVPRALRERVWAVTDTEYRRRRRELRDLRARQRRAAILIARQTGGLVATGPFAGMKYPTDGRYPQKLLGTYELELHDVLRSTGARNLQRVVDIGAAEGYYVCGCARLFPTANVIAFEANTAMHSVIGELAALNGITNRLEVRGVCTRQELSSALDGSRVLVICDAEGAEADLLRPDQLPGLRYADLLVEAHDLIVPGITEELVRRFAGTHDVDVLTSRERTASDFPAGIDLVRELILPSMEESRGGVMKWVWARSLDRA
jgi:hypothetical protein